MTDTELMDLLAPTDEQKAALHARDMQHCPQTALEGTVLPGVKFYYEGKADKTFTMTACINSGSWA